MRAGRTRTAIAPITITAALAKSTSVITAPLRGSQRQRWRPGGIVQRWVAALCSSPSLRQQRARGAHLLLVEQRRQVAEEPIFLQGGQAGFRLHLGHCPQRRLVG